MKSEHAAMVGMEHTPKDHAAMDHTGHEDHAGMVRQMREKWLWTNFAVISLGVWLISSPFTFGYASRGMIWSDVASGVSLIFFSALALWPRFDFVGRWSVSCVGAWLQFAPLIFWAPMAVSYLNDTLVGVIAIVLSILVPMMPGMAHHMEMKKPGPLIPPGWTYNPSSWHQRAPMIGLAFIGWLASRYLAAFQLGYITTIWDPFFGNGTMNVLHSDVSKAFPISDAGLGAAAYTIEMLMGWMGGKERWRSMPWMVTFFFILVVPLGMVSITLIILQPLAVGSWCSVCLFTALVMLTMIPFAVDEVVATLQFLKRSVHEGKPLWRTFWVGGTLAEVNEDQRTPKYGASVSKHAGPMGWGVTAPWNLVASAALGIWLMFSPAVFGTQAGAADSDHLVGALITAVAVIVMAEVIRAGRFLNVLLGAWIIAAPWLLSGPGTTARWNDVLAGAIVILLSLPRGPVREQYAGWNRLIV